MINVPMCELVNDNIAALFDDIDCAVLSGCNLSFLSLLRFRPLFASVFGLSRNCAPEISLKQINKRPYVYKLHD